MSDHSLLEPTCRAAADAYLRASPLSGPRARVDAALARTALTANEPQEELRAAVCAYVALCRAQGMHVEQVVIALKRQLAAHGFRGELVDRDRLFDQIVTLCIQTYFTALLDGAVADA